jgi:hypothetical protein
MQCYKHKISYAKNNSHMKQFIHINYLYNLWIDRLCDRINSFTYVSFFSLPEAYFLDDMILLKFREQISSKK